MSKSGFRGIIFILIISFVLILDKSGSDPIKDQNYVRMETAAMNIQVIRASQTWQQAGAYYVRIQGMARQHNISLRQEFDDHDTPNTEYIVLTDNDFPVATCRFYKLDECSAMIGRVVVLPEYRGKGLGKQTVLEAEKWLKEKGIFTAVIESRTVAVGFYEKLGYIVTDESIIHGDTFDCIRMEKKLDDRKYK